MNKDLLNQIMNLIGKTGDKCVILNEGNEGFVIMRIKDYEKLILAQSGVSGLTEEELLDKINREIAVWKANTERDVLDRFDIDADLKSEPDEKYYVEPL